MLFLKCSTPLCFCVAVQPLLTNFQVTTSGSFTPDALSSAVLSGATRHRGATHHKQCGKKLHSCTLRLLRHVTVFLRDVTEITNPESQPQFIRLFDNMSLYQCLFIVLSALPFSAPSLPTHPPVCWMLLYKYNGIRCYKLSCSAVSSFLNCLL